MSSLHYYNEFDPYAAQWLGNLIERGLIPYGDVDSRDIRDVKPEELRDYTQCHFFAGIGGWPLALRLVGWPQDRPVWTGSCPCQPFSVAGKQQANKDDRHLWPTLAKLIAARAPNEFFGEQVSNAIGHDWLDTVFGDLNAQGYQTGAAVLSASSVGAPHERKRLYFGALADGARFCERKPATRDEPVTRERTRLDACGRSDGNGGATGNAASERLEKRTTQHGESRSAQEWQAVERTSSEVWGGEWRECVDGKFRLFGSGVPLLANGLPRDLAGSLAGFGNAIVPQVAALFIEAWLEATS